MRAIMPPPLSRPEVRMAPGGERRSGLKVSAARRRDGQAASGVTASSCSWIRAGQRVSEETFGSGMLLRAARRRRPVAAGMPRFIAPGRLIDESRRGRTAPEPTAAAKSTRSRPASSPPARRGRGGSAPQRVVELISADAHAGRPALCRMAARWSARAILPPRRPRRCPISTVT